jgi:histidinol-phosphate/aromatic aminotransferase/cobyric acid decarboxylase-like protein
MHHRSCFHGGAFWEGIGSDFRNLEKRDDVLSADGLDAWFPPAPPVTLAVNQSWAWICRTSAPTHAEGLTQLLAEVRGVPAASMLVGPGSSALMYHALPRWLQRRDRVLLPEPCYGEYAHLCEQVIGCEVHRLETDPDAGFFFDLDRWASLLESGSYKLAVLVNPNNPTGHLLDHKSLGVALSRVPVGSRVLIDEAYIDYTGSPSAEVFTQRYPNVFVLKSLSKALALSGLRSAYLVGAVADLRRLAPPWWVSLPAQIASVAALRENDYYASRYAETAVLRAQLTQMLQLFPLEIFQGCNWLLLRLRHGKASQLVRGLAAEKIFVRDASATAASLGDAWLRVAVRSRPENERLAMALGRHLGDRAL